MVDAFRGAGVGKERKLHGWWRCGSRIQINKYRGYVTNIIDRGIWFDVEVELFHSRVTPFLQRQKGICLEANNL